MKALAVLVILALTVGTAGAWEITVTEGSKSVTYANITVYEPEECIIMDINKKTKIKVCKCGQVLVEEFKEVVPNKEQNTLRGWDGSYIYNTTTGRWIAQ